MGRSLPRLAFLGILLVFCAVSFVSAKKTELNYTPPEIASGNYLSYPIKSVASGVVVVAVDLDSAGRIKKTEVLRDIPSLTAPLLLAIDKWTFKPAVLRRKTVSSTIVVNILYNPSDYRLGTATAPVLGKELRVLAPDVAGFVPPKIIAGAWAEYPLNSVAQGSVILDARISPQGHVNQVTPVWRNQSLTTTSVDAAKHWTFHPATLDGEAVAANTVVGYVFRLPNIANPLAHP
jgi:hypothetical protein